ncbi:phospholipase D delta-like isoform X3 [Fagus crenata]
MDKDKDKEEGQILPFDMMTKIFSQCDLDKDRDKEEGKILPLHRISWIKSPAPYVLKDGTTSVPKDDPELSVSTEDDPESWHVQILRSIDSGSLKGFPKSPDLAEKQVYFDMMAEIFSSAHN